MSDHSKPNPPRRKQIRLRGHDYSQPGRYFITVCTHEKLCIFGDIHFGQLEPTKAGKIVQTCWHDLPSHYDGIHLDEFTVMPNHIHGVLILEKPTDAHPRSGIATPNSRTVAEIVRAFKSFSARRINESTATTGQPIWQRGYYEHIIRTNKGFAAIRQYIRDNPGAWEMDPENDASPRKGRVSDPPLQMPKFE